MSAFDRISARTPKETKSYVSKTLDLVERIQDILQSTGMTQKDLAEKLEKSPSEVSKWMTGLHHFNLKTLVKIEEALGEEIFQVPSGLQAASKEGIEQNAAELLAMFNSLDPELQQQVLDFTGFLIQKSNEGASAGSADFLKKSQKMASAIVNEPGETYRKKTE